MKDLTYTLYNSEGDKFFLRLVSEGSQFLSEEMVSYLHEHDFELYGIYLERLGVAQKVAPIRLLNKISQLIASFFIGHPNAILFYQCDDISEVPMSLSKKNQGTPVQEYRNRLFTKLFEKHARKLSVSVVDTPIYIDACGNEVFIHLISRNIHTDFALAISKDIHKGFDK